MIEMIKKKKNTLIKLRPAWFLLASFLQEFNIISSTKVVKDEKSPLCPVPTLFPGTILPFGQSRLASISLHKMQRAYSFACRLVCGNQTSPHQKGKAWTCNRKVIPVNNCRQGCAVVPWQWGRGSCITPCSGVERQISFVMLHDGVRSFGAGRIYSTPAS